MLTLPADTAVTLPVALSTVALAVLALDQVPPDGLAVSILVAPTHALVVPVTVGVPVAFTLM